MELKGGRRDGMVAAIVYGHEKRSRIGMAWAKEKKKESAAAFLIVKGKRGQAGEVDTRALTHNAS